MTRRYRELEFGVNEKGGDYMAQLEANSSMEERELFIHYAMEHASRSAIRQVDDRTVAFDRLPMTFIQQLEQVGFKFNRHL